jgi:uncharacterized membrane protein (DUF2068 family)
MTNTGRPGGVIIVALLNLLSAAVYGLALSPWDPFSEQGLLARYVPITAAPTTTLTAVVMGIGVVLHLAAAIGLFTLRPWGWRLAVLLTGVGLAFWLAVDIVDRPVSVRLAVYAAIAFYLNTSGVRDAFERSGAEPETSG